MYRWTPPDPRKLPDWRASMIEYLETRNAKRIMTEALRAGHSTLLPMIPGLNVSVPAVAAEILHQSEIARLRQARLYYASPDMTALALAASKTVPTEAVNRNRPPSPCGLIVFGEPIGGYQTAASTALAGTRAHQPDADALATTPIVAASWSPWHPDSASTDQGRVRWQYRTGGRTGFIPQTFTGIWVTFYSPRGSFSALATDTVIGQRTNGTAMTAGQVESARRTQGPVLAWDNEMVMREGGNFEEPQPDTNGAWAVAVYTAWQLMTQKGGEWTETETLTRSRAGVKRDAHGGITASSDVELVDVHREKRPSRSAAAQDAMHSTGRHEPHYSCRFPVAPYRRNTCLNTRAHADGGCQHEDRIVPGHLKGPEDAPLRVRDRVSLWDHQPAAE
ncbi:hypothetical protein [Streptomyces sp. NPDC047070]|uniref:hypothetical protein n=1 Tax=Streptomyces sp. NPDC047070 TaxID=3154923 RepID=UPI0034563FFA